MTVLGRATSEYESYAVVAFIAATSLMVISLALRVRLHKREMKHLEYVEAFRCIPLSMRCGIAGGALAVLGLLIWLCAAG
jgi:uncharacterized membrane protein